jgi:hypothetical protein
MYEEETTSKSPENEIGPVCANVEIYFPERTILHLISQSEINDLEKYLNISKIEADLLASRLWGRNFYSKMLKCHTGNASTHCQHFFKDGELVPKGLTMIFPTINS